MGAIVGRDRGNEASASVGLDDVAVHDVSLDECGDDEVGEYRKRSKRQDEVRQGVVHEVLQKVGRGVPISRW